MIDKADLNDMADMGRPAIWRHRLKEVPTEALKEELARRAEAEADDALFERLALSAVGSDPDKTCL